LYFAGVIGFTFFPFQIMYGRYADDIDWTNQINWYLLVTLDPSAVPNIVMTVPLGILLPLLSGRAPPGGVPPSTAPSSASRSRSRRCWAVCSSTTTEGPTSTTYSSIPLAV
jgi:hypothetical protein